jgi:hypothetical protein
LASYTAASVPIAFLSDLAQLAAESEYFHSPTDANVGRA